MKDDLAVLIPQRVLLDIRRTPNDSTDEIVSETVLVRHIRMGDLPAVMKSLAPIQYLIKDPKKINPRMVFLEHAEDAMNLISACMKVPREWVNTLEIDSCVELFSKLLEVNVGFFIKSILPSVLTAMGSLNSAVSKDSEPARGENSSPTLLQ